VLALASRYAGKIGGVVALSGYLPRGPKIKAGRDKFIKEDSQTKIFLAHGTRDMLVPVSDQWRTGEEGIMLIKILDESV
jgi:predicted esterase